MKSKKVDKGLIGAAKSQFLTIKAKVNKSRKALENDPIKAISVAVLQNIKIMKLFAQPSDNQNDKLSKKTNSKKNKPAKTVTKTSAKSSTKKKNLIKTPKKAKKRKAR